MQIGFTKKAQNALNRALYYACEMGHTCVGSEHLLLGLLSEKEGVAESILERRGITFDATRELIREHVGTGEATRLTAADITPRTKKIIEASARVAMDLGHGYIGTEHLLCAICDEPECFAVGLLQAQGVVAADVKRDIVSYFGQSEGEKADKNSERGQDRPHHRQKHRDGAGDPDPLAPDEKQSVSDR